MYQRYVQEIWTEHSKLNVNKGLECGEQCKLKNNQSGLCFGRTCKENQMVLATYGKSSGYCIDPIEKKPLFHFQPELLSAFVLLLLLVFML